MKLLRTKLAVLTAAVGVTAGSGWAQAAEQTIAFMRGGPDPYYQYGLNAAQAAADQLGVKLVTYTANNDPTQELANVQDAITRGVDGILIYAVSLSSEKASIAQAKRAQVPIFFQYGYDPSLLKDTAGFMEIDFLKFGEPIGEALGRLIPNGEVAIVTGKLGRGDAEGYAQSFKNGLKAVGSKADVVAELAADWDRQKALEAATQILSAHPAVKAIYAANDDMAVGVAIAIDRAGKTGQVLLGSCNGAPYGLDLIRKGKMSLTNGNPPSIATVQSLKLLLGVINGKVTPGRFYAAPTGITDRGNIDKAIPWDANAEQIAAWLAEPLPQPSPGPAVGNP